MLISTTSYAYTRVQLETGIVENSYNQVRIPGDAGTQFNIADSFDNQNYYYRLNLLYEFKERHGLRFLYAPLNVEGDKSYGKDISFQGATFNSGQKTDTFYKFNSYRASYYYQLINDKNFQLDVGGTLKIRDAKIRLEQGGQKKSRSDLGLVPLLYLNAEYRWDQMRVGLDFDGLAAPQGRAFDVALMGGYYFYPDLLLNFGYRMLEGGVDNDKVYNFSQFNFFFTSIEFGF